MNSVAPAVTAATMISAVVAILRLVEPFAASNGLTARAFFLRGKKHAPKEKGHDAGENQQQDPDVYPSGLGHLNLALFPRIGSQFNSMERM